MINKNLGYYICDGKEFSSKVDALIYSSVTKKEVSWYFHNDAFKNYNWSIEPEHSLDYYYDKRARELREKYDYLILSFSGGSDTNNILESFIRQGLHIDEIVTNHMSSATSGFTVLDKRYTRSSNFAAEHELQAVPRLKYISEKMPRTKITVLDVSDIVLNSILEYDVDWVLKRNDHLSIGQLFRYNYFHFGEMKKKFDKNKKIGIIVGLEKPKTSIVSAKEFYISFNDTVANITTINDFNDEYDNTVVEMFYWSSETLDMMAKQAHVIYNFLKKNPRMIPYWRLQHTINGVTYSNAELNRMIHEKVLRNIIYTTWDSNWFQTDKSILWWNTEFDDWFRADQKYKKQQEIWKRGMAYLESKIPEYIVYRDNMMDRMKVFSHSYYVKEI